jgi:succinate dehydrogenase / fumarate reductase flavoprotein subunit
MTDMPTPPSRRPPNTAGQSTTTRPATTPGEPIATPRRPAARSRSAGDPQVRGPPGQPGQPPQALVIVVGTGLAGALGGRHARRGRLQREVLLLPGLPAPRALDRRPGRHQRGQELQGDGDSVYRLFYDTVKGGDYRSRESNVYRLAEVSANIIDQCVAQGVPFAREYGGLLDNRSFGGVQVSRTFYARGQTGQQLLIGAYQALERQVAAGTVSSTPATRCSS